jgi:hypothetical protein
MEMIKGYTGVPGIGVDSIPGTPVYPLIISIRALFPFSVSIALIVEVT